MFHTIHFSKGLAVSSALPIANGGLWCTPTPHVMFYPPCDFIVFGCIWVFPKSWGSPNMDLVYMGKSRNG